jgi:membrane protein DedA with SNARE-associated domain
VAGQGKLNIVVLLAVAWFAAVLGDSIGYLIGRTLGHQALVRYGPYIGARPALVEKFRQMFLRYGPFIVVLARLIEVLRQINGVLAGAMGMPWWRFLLCNAIGGAIWVGLWGGGAYYFGQHIDRILLLVQHHKRLSIAIAVALGLALLVAALRFFKRRRGKP